MKKWAVAVATDALPSERYAAEEFQSLFRQTTIFISLELPASECHPLPVCGTNAERKNISVSQDDDDPYCRCERCEAINQAEGTPMGSHLALVNEVAEALEKEFPDGKVGTLSYWYTRRPPRTMKPRHNVQIQFYSIECCTLYPLDDPKAAVSPSTITTRMRDCC